jgi:hypothetical protein
LPARTLAFEKENSAPRHKLSEERFAVVCCKNASRNHKLKLEVIGKAKNPLSFKGTKTNRIPVHHYNHKGAWMDGEIF